MAQRVDFHRQRLADFKSRLESRLKMTKSMSLSVQKNDFESVIGGSEWKKFRSEIRKGGCFRVQQKANLYTSAAARNRYVQPQSSSRPISPHSIFNPSITGSSLQSALATQRIRSGIMSKQISPPVERVYQLQDVINYVDLQRITNKIQQMDQSEVGKLNPRYTEQIKQLASMILNRLVQLKMLYLLLLGCYSIVEVTVSSPWKGPTQESLLQERAEYWSRIGLFWDYLDSLEGGGFMDDVEDIVQLSLSNREFAPALEMYSNFSKEVRQNICKFFAFTGAEMHCRLIELYRTPLMKLETFEIDKIFNRQGNTTFIIYGDITDSSFIGKHKMFKEIALERNAQYVLRHFDLRNVNQSDYLGAFGVSFNVKNLEYNTSGQKLESNLPSKLINATYPANVISKNFISQGKFEELVEFLGNLPVNSDKLQGQNYEKFQLEVESRLKVLKQIVGENYLQINNHPVVTDLFEILPYLRRDKYLLTLLKQQGIQDPLQLLCHQNKHLHQIYSDKGVIKTDESTGRLYLNDLEKDKQYKKYGKTIESFLLNFQMNPVALNVLNLVIVADISTSSGWQALQLAPVLNQQGLPLHIGILLVNEFKRTNLLIKAIKLVKKADERLPFLLVSILSQEFDLEELNESIEMICSQCEKVQDIGTEEEIFNAQQFCEEVNFCTEGLILNGRILDVNLYEEEGNLGEKLMQEIYNEKLSTMELYRNNQLKYPIQQFFEKGQHGKLIRRLNQYISNTDIQDYLVIESNIVSDIVWNQHHKSTLTLILDLDNQDKLQHLIDFDLLSDRKVRIQLFLKGYDKKTADMWYKLREVKDIQDIGNWQSFKSSVDEHIAQQTLILNQQILKKAGANLVGAVYLGRIIPIEHIKSYRDIEILIDSQMKLFGLDNKSFLDDQKFNDLFFRQSLKSAQYLPNFKQYQHPFLPIGFQQENTNAIYIQENANFEVQALINPLSDTGLKLSYILLQMKKLGSQFKISFNPLPNETETQNRFYQYHIKNSIDQKLTLEVKQSTIVSLQPEVGENWLIRQNFATTDPDNLFLLEDARIDYLVVSLLITGHCIESKYGIDIEPPNGLQLKLMQDNEQVDDTIVMKSLGYFQFRAQPGVYSIQLQDGKSKELYRILKGKIQSLYNFNSQIKVFKVEKKFGKEQEKLLDPQLAQDKGETIHIFSLASGKLYEKLLRVMMLSVIKNTKQKVKFWLLEDFFSPEFLHSIHKYAENLNSEVELVSYKWPTWLFRQKEKQRIIWSYKILFLDVLFPLNINKIIYIDADQIVKSDIKELWDLDLNGAPYAYAPFCQQNPNKDTLGYRFWTQGFWKDHLKGKPYHISALYVVDLHIFRAMAAGDILRYFYSQMAPDPNSLSNLDQDLPNFTQDIIPIFTLPEAWLWCDAWCSQDSLEKAKTIDLCNNPLTKEVKVEAARRIIKDWDKLNYDAETLLDF